mgnify:CR=1 FL=1
MNYLMNGLAALAFIVLFSQCAGKTDNQTSTTPAQVNAELSGMKIAYVEIDSLLAKYNFCIDLNEAMVKKSENVRMTLNQKATALNKEKQDFQKKYENGAFLSGDRARQARRRAGSPLPRAACARRRREQDSLPLCGRRAYRGAGSSTGETRSHEIKDLIALRRAAA